MYVCSSTGILDTTMYTTTVQVIIACIVAFKIFGFFLPSLVLDHSLFIARVFLVKITCSYVVDNTT